jgi:choice-of-anchor C domain-containing protein
MPYSRGAAGVFLAARLEEGGMRPSGRRLCILMALAVLTFTNGLAQETLVNRSFENGTDPGDAAVLPPGSKAIEGWTVVDGNVSYVGRQWQHSQGSRSVALQCGAGLSQTLATTPNYDYEVRFTMAGDPSAVPPLKTLIVKFGEQERTFTFDTSGRNPRDMGWTTRTWVFKSSSNATALTFLSPKANCSVPAIDNVRIEAVEIGV